MRFTWTGHECHLAEQFHRSPGLYGLPPVLDLPYEKILRATKSIPDTCGISIYVFSGLQDPQHLPGSADTSSQDLSGLKDNYPRDVCLEVTLVIYITLGLMCLQT